jgi:hypothetical protein
MWLLLICWWQCLVHVVAFDWSTLHTFEFGRDCQRLTYWVWVWVDLFLGLDLMHGRCSFLQNYILPFNLAKQLSDCRSILSCRETCADFVVFLEGKLHAKFVPLWVVGFLKGGMSVNPSFILSYTKQSLWELIFYWEKEKFSDLDVCSISICSNTSPRTNGKSLFSFTEFYLWKKFLCEKIATSIIHIVSSVNSDKPSQN